MVAHIAIDFGTARTKLAYTQADGQSPELLRFNADDVERSYVPSLFYLPKEGGPALFGFAAEAMLEEDPAGIIDDLKRRLRDPKRRANGQEETPEALLTLLFSYLRQQALRTIAALQDQGTVEVLLTVPAAFGPAQRDVLKRAALAAGFETIGEPVDEPVAAACGWLADGGQAASGLVVMDCGGGTVDWAYVRRHSDGQFRLVAELPPGGIERLGGHDIDDALVDLVERKLAEAGVESAEFGVIRRARIRARMRRLKERLQRVETGSHRLRVGDAVVEMGKDEIEAVVRDHFVAQAVDGVMGYVQRVADWVPEGERPVVLLVGGSGKLPGLAVALAARGAVIVPWDRAEYGAVVGALRRMAVAQTRLVSNGKTLVVQAPRRVAVEQQHFPAVLRPSTVVLDKNRLAGEEVLFRESGVSLKSGNYEHALLLCLTTWVRASQAGAIPDDKLALALKNLDILTGCLATYPVTGCNEVERVANGRILMISEKRVCISKNKADLLLFPAEWKDHMVVYCLAISRNLDVAFTRDLHVHASYASYIIFDLVSDQVLSVLNANNLGFPSSPDVAVFSADRRRIAIRFGKTILQYTSPPLGRIDSEINEVRASGSFEYSQDGIYLLAIGENFKAMEWNSADGTATGRVYNTESNCRIATYHMDGRSVLTLDESDTLTIWDRQSGDQVGEKMVHPRISGMPRFSAGRDLLVTFGSDGFARIWNALNGTPSGIELEHGAPITRAEFSPNGALMATACATQVKLWNAQTGAGIGVPIPLAKVASMCFSAGSERLLLAHASGVALWDVSRALFEGDELVYHLCHHRPTPLRRFTDLELRASLIADLDPDPAEACRKLFKREEI